ncbi:MAG: hypothetical protein WAQ98_14210 [Blastocatellia bacterium]
MSKNDKKNSKADSPKNSVVPVMLGGAAIYQTQHNGSRPFTVLVDEQNSSSGTCVLVYSTRNEDDEDELSDPVDYEHYQQFPPKPEELLIKWENVVKVWVARCPSLYADESEALGNTLLLQIPTDKLSSRKYTYVYIGSSIYEFATKKPITEFESPIDNNYVPYPAALSDKEVFFLLDMLRLPRKEIKNPVISPEDKEFKNFSSEELQWIFIYENLYGTPKQQRKWKKQGFSDHPKAKPLKGYKELVASPCY